jgi:cytochrome c oxidase subunit 1
MLGAKLFSLSGLVFLVAGLFLRPVSRPSIDISVHGTYFVVGHFHFLLLSSFFCWTYAGLYYLGARLFGLAFNSILIVAHLFLTLLALLAWNSIGLVGARRSSEVFLPKVRSFFVQHMSVSLIGHLLLISLGLFLVIVVLAGVRRVRRTAS